MKILKVVTIGQSDIGKTKLIAALRRKDFVVTSKKTIGVDFKTYRIKQDKQEGYQFWDTEGMDPGYSSTSIRHVYYRNADVVLLCFDPFKKESFTALSEEMPLLKKNVKSTCQFVLIETRSDDDSAEAKEKRTVTEKDIEQFQQEHESETSPVHYQQTSAKNGKGIQELHTILDDKFRALYPNDDLLQASSEHEPQPQQHSTNYSFQFSALTKIAALGSVALGIAALITASMAATAFLAVPLLIGSAVLGGVAMSSFFYHRYTQDPGQSQPVAASSPNV